MATSKDGARSSQTGLINVDDTDPPVYAERLRRVQELCEGYHGKGFTDRILVALNMSFAVIPKASCTFWTRVFRFLNNDTFGRKLDNPFQMSKDEAHMPLTKTKFYRLQNEKDRRVVMATTRFMVARNPFTRLFSAYIDKFYVYDYGYRFGKTIVSRRQNASALSRRCGHDVTFSEFLSYVVDVGERNVLHLDVHWRPIEHICHPCVYKPDIIVKMETLSKDAHFILSKFSLNYLLQNQSFNNHVVDAMAVGPNYEHQSACLTRKQRGKRLWRAVQINGFLTPGSESVLETESPENLTGDRMNQLMSRSYLDHILTKEQSSAQRRASLRQAYASVPRDIINRVVKLFRKDFLFFDYDTSIDNLWRE